MGLSRQTHETDEDLHDPRTEVRAGSRSIDSGSVPGAFSVALRRDTQSSSQGRRGVCIEK